MTKLDPYQFAGGGSVLAFLTLLFRRILNVSKVTLRFSSPEQDARITELEKIILDLRQEITTLKIDAARHQQGSP